MRESYLGRKQRTQAQLQQSAPHAALLMNRSDRYFANVSALFHFNDAAGSASFVDNSIQQHNLTPTSPADTSSTQSVFGGRSLSTSTGKASNTTITAYQFGTGDFTIEFRFYCGELTTTRVFFSMANTWTSADWTNTANLFLWSTGQMTYRCGTDYNSATGVLSLNTWHAVCIERAGTALKVYVNGISVISGTDSRTYGLVNTNSPVIKLPANSTSVSGSYYDELRITKGVARYQGNYTVANQPFPNQ